MLLLTSTSDAVTLVTAAATSVYVQASYVDMSGSTITPGRTNTVISSATTTTIVPSPAASTQRNVKQLIICSLGGAQAITLKHTDGTNLVTLSSPTLAISESLVFTDGFGFQVLDINGAVKISPQGQSGRFIKRTVLTTGSGNFTTDPKTNSMRIVLVGGGGGGGGTTSVSVSAACGGGGGSGGYLDKWVACSPATAYAYVVGALGGGGAATGATGTIGASSTFIVGGTTYTAYYGSGGVGMTGTTTEGGALGGTGGIISTNGDINGSGQSGEPGWIRSGTVGYAGNGGSTVYGGGGKGTLVGGVGGAAVGYGAGGGGGSTLNGGSAVAGGAGVGGLIIVDEYI